MRPAPPLFSNRLKSWIFTLLTLFTLAHAAFGQEREFPQYNFAITPPDGWTAITNVPPQKGLIAIFGNAETSRLIVLVAIAAKKSDGPLNDAYIANFEKGLVNSGGGERLSWKFIEIQGLKAYERLGILAKGQKRLSTLNRLVPTEKWAYSLAALCTDGDTADAPEIQQSLASFRFLTPPKPPLSAAQAAGYRAGYQAGVLFVPALILILIIYVMIRAFRFIRDKNEQRRHTTPPPLPPRT